MSRPRGAARSPSSRRCVAGAGRRGRLGRQRRGPECCRDDRGDRDGRRSSPRRRSRNAQHGSPGGDSSRAALWARPRRANLPMAKAEESGKPFTLAVAPVSRIAPWPCGAIRRAACWTTRKPPKAETAIAWRTCSGSSSAMRPRTPAAGVVEDDVRLADPCVRGLEQPLDGGGIGGVDGEGLRPRLGRQWGELVHIPCGQAHPYSCVCQTAGDRGADAGGRRRRSGLRDREGLPWKAFGLDGVIVDIKRPDDWRARFPQPGR